MNNKRILVTGGLGFIGSNFINHVLQTYDNVKLFNIDNNGIGSSINNIDIDSFKEGNIYDWLNWDLSKGLRGVPNSLPFDYVFHFAAESHVDRSIESPKPFIQSNVLGTLELLEFCKNQKVKRLINISTDEVVGSINRGAFKESDPYNPSSVYSASKASQELLGNAYSKTFGLDIITTRCSNNYGPRQFEEKLIPKVINNAINNEKIPVYDEGLQRREWTFVQDHIDDLIFIAKYGASGEIYNVGKGIELTNIEIVKKILKYVGKSEDLIEFVPNARLGHDFRYSINLNKINALENYDKKKVNKTYFNKRLKETINYYEKTRDIV